MSNVIRSFCLFAFVGLLMTGCQKDDEKIAPRNVFTYNGIEYDLAKGILLDYGQIGKGEGHTQHLYLYSSGISIHESNGKFDSTSGKGHFIYFEIFSPTGGVLADGDYTYDINNTFKASTFDYSYAVLNSDPLTKSGDLYSVFWGDINIKKEDEKYAVTFDCLEAEGKHIAGFYKGALNYYYRGK